MWMYLQKSVLTHSNSSCLIGLQIWWQCSNLCRSLPHSPNAPLWEVWRFCKWARPNEGIHVISCNYVIHVLLVGGLEHFFPITYEIILPIDNYFSRWLKHVKTTNQIVCIWWTEWWQRKTLQHMHMNLAPIGILKPRVQNWWEPFPLASLVLLLLLLYCITWNDDVYDDGYLFWLCNAHELSNIQTINIYELTGRRRHSVDIVQDTFCRF